MDQLKQKPLFPGADLSTATGKTDKEIIRDLQEQLAKKTADIEGIVKTLKLHRNSLWADQQEACERAGYTI